MASSIKERFKAFISQLPSAEVIDDLDLPSEFDDEKRADFLIENRRTIIELKTLESDPEYKVHNELNNHKERDEYPLFYGELELNKVLKHLPDGTEINKKIFYKISRSVEKAFRKADKQIGATKEILGCENSFGLLVFLNEDIEVLSPETIAYRVSELLAKTESNGQVHYKNITSVWFILENYTLKTKGGSKLLPSIMIDGPGAVDQNEFSQVLDKLQRMWASFNNVPIVTADIKKIDDTKFIPISKLEAEHQRALPRHELWRKHYRKSPYLRTLSDEDVLKHGSRLVGFMTPHFIKGGHKIPFDKMTQFMEGWTHFLEEIKFRGLDLKQMPKENLA